MVMLVDVPERSLQQRLDALEKGNRIRLHRAQVKRDIKAGRRHVVDELIEVDPRLASMHVWDLLMAVPKFGRVKVNKVLSRNMISPSKTVGGLSARQRRVLVLALGGSSAGRAMVRDDG